MKIAIPSTDNKSVFGHFGKAKGFTICEIEDNKVVDRKHIDNTFTGHAQEKNHAKEEHHEAHGLQYDGGHEHHHHEGGHEHHGGHSHEGIFKAIGDCDVVIAGGMGRRLYNEFLERNIKVFVTKETSIDRALEVFLSGDLDNNPDKCCNH